ncbi:hypothetical protein [Flexithrix dorotheae]|uniref:hypothetical protein n=1 Tax=Flexithrix dorotheae TaxID=70993 RepID=UPI0003A5BD8E|nr:hypothetical protein [Flexithrix dorotheae]
MMTRIEYVMKNKWYSIFIYLGLVLVIIYFISFQRSSQSSGNSPMKISQPDKKPVNKSFSVNITRSVKILIGHS